MSDLSSTSCGGGFRGDSGISPIFLILILLCLGGGDGGSLFGNCGIGGGCGGDCGSNNGLGGILPILLVLCLCGGSSFC